MHKAQAYSSGVVLYVICMARGENDDNSMEMYKYLEDRYLVMRMHTRVNVIVADHNWDVLIRIRFATHQGGILPLL